MSGEERRAYFRKWYRRNLKRCRRYARLQRRRQRKDAAVREKASAYNKKRWWTNVKENRKRVRAYIKQWRKKHPVKARALAHRFLYGLERCEYLKILKSQKKRCAICKKRFKKTPHVDHCHRSKKIRGLLCGPCNIGLGMMKHSKRILKSAIRYL